jgi:uncharacterized membrane protein
VNPLKRVLGLVLHFCEHKEIHAFKIRLNDRVYYVCARCSGLYLGMFSGFPITLLLIFFAPFVYQLGDIGTTSVAFLFALPAMLDWTTQRLAWRESRNAIRFWTALPAGFSLSWYLLSPVSFLIKVPVLFGVLIFLVIFGFIDRRSPFKPSEKSSHKNTEPTEATSPP